MKKGFFLAILVISLGGMALLFADKLAAWALRSTIREAKDLGIEIALKQLHWRRAEISIQAPRLGLTIPSASLRFDFNLMPPAIDVAWKDHFGEIKGAEISAKDLALELHFNSRLGTTGFFYGNVNSKALRFGETTISQFHLQGEVRENAEFSASAVWSGETVKLKGKTELGKTAVLFAGPMELEVGKSRVSGNLELIERSSVLELKSLWTVGVPDVLEAKKVQLTAEFGKGVSGNLVFSESGFKSPYLWLNTPLQLSFKEEAKGFQVVLKSEDFDPFLPEAVEDLLVPARFGIQSRLLWKGQKLGGGFSIWDRNRKLRLEGRLSSSFGEKSAALSVGTALKFGNHLSWNDLFQTPKGKIESLEGTLGLRATVVAKQWTPQSAFFEVETEGIKGTFWKTPIRGLATQARLQVLPALKMPSKANLELSSLGSDFQLTEMKTAYRLIDSQHLEVDTIQARLAEGHFEVDPLQVEFEHYDFASKVTLNNLQLEPLLASSGFSRLSGKGRVSGVIPIRREKGEWYVEGAKLQNVEKGTLSYKDESTRGVKKRIEYWDEFEELLAQGNQALVMKALDDFHYDVLALKADRSPQKGLSVDLHLKGRNPDLARGQPFEIDLPITGALESLLSETVWKGLIEEEGWEERWEKLKEFRR